MIRTSIFIGSRRISDNDFTRVFLDQKVGEHHFFEIRLRQDAKKGELLEKAKSWIGQTVNIGIGDRDDTSIIAAPLTDIFKGYVTSLGLSRKSGTGEIIVRGYSPTIMMDDGPNARSFTDMSLQEIIDQVIIDYEGGYSNAPKIEPKIHQGSIPYTVQYKESNFSFVNRLANRFGEWFFYDGIDLHFGNVPADGEVINLDLGENGLREFDLCVKALPVQQELKAYDYVKAEVMTESAPLTTTTNELGAQALDLAKSKIFTQTPSVAIHTASDKDELKSTVLRREQIALDEMVILAGESRNSRLKLGAKIAVRDQAISEEYGEYIIVKIEHEVGQAGEYLNKFEAIPVEVTTPPLTEINQLPFCETQLAIVKDVNDDDSLGRIKVEFFWQEGSGETSPWVRVASPYTGGNKGFYVVPEVGDSVLVSFEENNADKPYMLSGLYNGKAKPEWFDGNNYFKGFKTQAQNQVKFDDTAKSILVDAPQSITMSAGNDITIKTGGGAKSTIDLDAGEGTITIKAKIINVIASDAVNVDAKKINESATDISTTASNSITMDAKASLKSTSAAITIESTATTDVKSKAVNVDGSLLVNVTGATVKLN